MLFTTDYDFVFWAHGLRDGFEVALKVTNFMQRYGDEYVPKYTGEKKLELTPINLREEFANDVRDQMSVVELRSENGLGLHVRTDPKAYQNVQFPQTLRISFTLAHLIGEKPLLSMDQLEEIFQSCLVCFIPYYAYGSSSGEINYSKKYENLFRTVDIRRIPMIIQWFNFFESAMVERLGGEGRLLAAPVFKVRRIAEPKGIVLILQQEPFDYRNPDHIQQRQVVEDYLTLSNLHQRYPKQIGPRRAPAASRLSTGPTFQLLLQYPATPEDAAKHAQLAVEAANKIGDLHLDYSPESIATVDQIIIGFHDQLLVPAQIGGTVFALGCYVGEILVRYQQGRWRSGANINSFMLVQLPHGIIANPLEKAFKLLESGETERLEYWYHALSMAVARLREGK